MQTSGSKRVAQHANRHLKRFLFESPAFQAGRYEDAVREAISKEESSLLESFRNGDHEFAVSGSTVSLAIVNLTKGILVPGNLGDSSILMGQYGRARKLDNLASHKFATYYLAIV
jgi:serine/threonine protein phosphatase PrpC